MKELRHNMDGKGAACTLRGRNSVHSAARTDLLLQKSAARKEEIGNQREGMKPFERKRVERDLGAYPLQVRE